MNQNDIENMAQGFPPLSIGRDYEEVVIELAKHSLALQQRLNAVLAGLDSLAGAMLNRTLDSGSKQAVAYSDCADMLAKHAAQLRAETDTTPSQYESLAKDGE